MSIVFFDLETTGLDTRVCEIIQLAAVCGERQFNVYSLPEGPINSQASQITGLTVDNGVLYHNGRGMGTFSLHQALDMFMSFLNSCRRRSSCNLQLAAHNGRNFDWPVLARALQQFSLLHNFQQVVPECLDTLLLSRRLFGAQVSHSLENLVQRFLNKSHKAHNALNDARALQELYYEWNPSGNDVVSSTFHL